MANKHVRCSTTFHQGNANYNNNDTTTPLLKWLKSGTLTTPSAGEDVEQHCWWECKMKLPLWNVVWQFTTTLNTLIIHSSNYAPGYSPKEVENSHTHRNLYTDVYSCFTHNSPNGEATKMYSSR